MKISDNFKNGIIKQNPIFVQLIGMCSVLAVSSSLKNSVTMAVAVIGVLVLSNVVISMIRKVTPEKIRIPIFIVVIATFVTLVEMLMKAFMQPMYQALGIFIPLIVVNCLILARAEAFASKNSVFKSAIDGVAMGLGYGIAIVILGTIREIIGSGSIWGIQLFGESFQPAALFIAPPGAFILLGILIAIFRTVVVKRFSEE
ncbi:electron transport complex subunit E [Soehngenia saccharolytica]|jgi:electron transport complex protein RnfE|nr:electron transport complex subunit E [Soehngenia saccharolytica]